MGGVQDKELTPEGAEEKKKSDKETNAKGRTKGTGWKKEEIGSDETSARNGAGRGGQYEKGRKQNGTQKLQKREAEADKGATKRTRGRRHTKECQGDNPIKATITNKGQSHILQRHREKKTKSQKNTPPLTMILSSPCLMPTMSRIQHGVH